MSDKSEFWVMWKYCGGWRVGTTHKTFSGAVAHIRRYGSSKTDDQYSIGEVTLLDWQRLEKR